MKAAISTTPPFWEPGCALLSQAPPTTVMMSLSCSQYRSLAAGLQRRNAAPRCRRVGRLCVSSKLVLTPTGNGSTEHIGEEVPLPGPIELKEGLFELGRAAPADIVIPIPTVSTRHAMLRVADAAEAAAGGVQVSDLGSTNGTFVEGEELAPMKAVALPVGGTVVFGDKYLAAFRLDFIPDAPPPPPAAAPAEEPAAAAAEPAAPAAPAPEQ